MFRCLVKVYKRLHKRILLKTSLFSSAGLLQVDNLVGQMMLGTRYEEKNMEMLVLMIEVLEMNFNSGENSKTAAVDGGKQWTIGCIDIVKLEIPR